MSDKSLAHLTMHRKTFVAPSHKRVPNQPYAHVDQRREPETSEIVNEIVQDILASATPATIHVSTATAIAEGRERHMRRD